MNAQRQSTMFAVALVAMCVAASEVRAQPTVVWTASDATAILSGPGEQFYPVLKVPAGTQLEVHQQLPGGWLAIRPPAGSFSLISATAIESVDYRTARVTRDGAASRVGSALVGDYDAVHVRLHRGELLEVLDPSPDPDTHLVRIAPPAGEFRWVHESNISRRPVAVEATATAPVTAAAEVSATNAASGDTAESVTLAPDTAIETATEPPAQGEPPSTGEWRVREAAAEESDDAAAGQVESVRYDSPATDSNPRQQGEASGTTAAAPAAETAGQAGTAAQQNGPSQGAAAGGTPATQAGQETVAPKQLEKSFTAQLDQLEIQISRRVAGPPNLWVFDDLEREAARLASIATTKDEMATIRELGIRMSRFTAIAARHRALGQQQLAAGGATRMAAPAGTGQDIGPIPPASGYDAVGILRPVVSKRPGAPPYALVDERGEVVTFVTPGPAVNMQAYLGKRVAVSGTRAYLPEYRRRNIQTARVTPMEGNPVR